MKSAFTLIEVLVATAIMSIVMVVSLQSVSYVNQIHQQNEIRYLALNRIDSEMSRLVMAYDSDTPQTNPTNFSDTTNQNDNANWNVNFDISNDFGMDNYIIYNDTGDNWLDFGLLISDNPQRNLVELRNINGNNNQVDDEDFVALLGWRISDTALSGNNINISLSLTYPFIFDENTQTINQLWDFTETINLKTSTRIP